MGCRRQSAWKLKQDYTIIVEADGIRPFLNTFDTCQATRG